MANTFLWPELPLEVRHIIYQELAFEDDSTDIPISLVDDNSSTQLEAPVIDMLDQLSQVSQTTYQEAFGFLTSRSCRWVIHSGAQPHIFVFRALRTHLDAAIRGRIRHIYLPKVGIRGVSDPLRVGDIPRPRDGHTVPLPPISQYTPYLRRIDPNAVTRRDHDNSTLATTIYGDINRAFMILPHVLPNVEKIDMSLDIFDCLGDNQYGDAILFRLSKVLTWSPQRRHDGPAIFQFVDLLSGHRNIQNIDIRVFWDDFYHRGRNLAERFPVEKKAMQDLFIEDMKMRVPAKSITGYPKVEEDNDIVADDSQYV